MKPQSAKILGSISVLIGLVGVALPLSAAFLEPVEQCLAAALHIPAHISDANFPGDLLTYSVLFLPLNIIALIIGILSRRSRLGKAGIIIAAGGICLAVGSLLGVLMLSLLLWTSPRVFPSRMPY
jgi:hypothetical protein